MYFLLHFWCHLTAQAICSLVPTVVLRSFPARLLYSRSLPSLSRLFCPDAELRASPCWTQGFFFLRGCLSVHQPCLHDLASAASLMCWPVGAIVDSGEEQGGISSSRLLNSLPWALPGSALPCTAHERSFRHKGAFCSEIVFWPSWRDLQRSLVSVLKNKLGFCVRLTGLYIRTKTWSCLGLGSRSSASLSYCGWVDVGDPLRTPLLVSME